MSNYKLIQENSDLAYQLYSISAYWFYTQLIAPILEAKTKKDLEHLVIVPDGLLGNLPFETFLRTPAPRIEGNYKELDYLLNHYKIIYSYSASLMWQALLAPRSSNNRKILAIAATYGQEAMNSIVAKPILSADSLPLEQLALRSGGHLRSLCNKLKPLPSAQTEVRTLEAGFQGSFWTGAQANESNFKVGASEYSVLHLAMHGILHKRQPILSSLAFTETVDSLEDNFLQAYEIYRLKLQADLVVLSACETGYGKFQQGEGILSMAHAFMYAESL